MNKKVVWSFFITLCFLIFMNSPAIATESTEELYNHHYKESDLKKISIEIQDYKNQENNEKKLFGLYFK